MLLGAALPLVGIAAMPVIGEAAVAAGAPALAARAVTGAAGASLYGKVGAAGAAVAREAQYQTRSALEQPQAAPEPVPTANPALDELLAKNDLTPFPNITRALQESGGMRQLQHAFGTLNGQPLNPELNALQAPVSPQSLQTPLGSNTLIDPETPAAEEY